MKIIEPFVELITPVDGDVILKRLEQCGRVCYKSEERISDTSAPEFVAGIISRGHEAVLEHCSVTVKFTCDRGVSHEIVRHRLASYCQESTRYCNYSGGKFGKEITVIDPVSAFSCDPCDAMSCRRYQLWLDAMEYAEKAYLALLKCGASPQEARAVLPNSLKTEVVMTANLREWRHFLKLRCAVAVHPQMREIALALLAALHDRIPVVFDDLWDTFKTDYKMLMKK